MTYVANSIVTVDGKEYRPGDASRRPPILKRWKFWSALDM